MAVQMFAVPVEGPGSMWIMPCPAGATLAQDIAGYRAAGATHIVSMLAEDEAQALGVAQEAALCAAEGLTFHTHPIADFGLPDEANFAALVGQVVDWIAAGKHVAVHCRAGIGRSGMVTAGVMIAQGLSAEVAMAHVSKARGVSIPDTVEQATFLASFAKTKFG